LVARGELAADGLVVTPSGTIPARALRPGEDVWALDPAGRLTTACVTDVVPGGAAASIVHLFTRAGEVLAPGVTRLATAKGPVAAANVRLGEDPLELLAPGDFLAPANPPRNFASVEAIVHTIPEDVADHELLGQLLERAQIEYSLRTGGGWLAVRLGQTDGTRDWTWADELALLLELTIWTREGDNESEHRTRIEQRDLRARLVAALVACHQPFELRWLPAYFPVEARISLTDATPRPFTEVVARRESLGDTVEVEIKDATSIVVDLAYARLQRQGNGG
jgi:hypothetical protein